MVVLVVEGLVSGYHKVKVLYGIDLYVDDKEVVGIVGPNGAGKTTLLKTIIGLVKAWSGKIRYLNKDITNMNTYDIIRQGIGYAPERGGIFRTLTVRENIELVLSIKPEAKDRLLEVYKLFPILRERSEQRAGTLSGGEQKMLTLAKALLFAEKLIILDEPSAGLAPVLREKLAERLKYINKELGISLLIAEQDPTLIMRIAGRVYIMEHGKIIKSGGTEELIRKEVLREHYLGL